MKTLASAGLALTLSLLALPASAQTADQCFPREDLVSQLEGNWEEVPTGRGLVNDNQMVEIWRSGETGSFSIVITQANGLSCLVASGHNWIDIVPAMMIPGVDG